MHELWGDEAETALFARNILKYGVPKGWDGTNIMGINNGVVLDNNLLNHKSPWAQYYMVAGSFALFGQSSFSARLPSILLYLVTVPLLYGVALRVTGQKRLAFLATIISVLSVQGILYGYQARYYQLVVVSGLLFFWASLSLMRYTRLSGIVFVLAGVLFFYANYVSWSAFYMAVFMVVGMYQWRSKAQGALRRFVFRFSLLTVPIVLCTLPWFLVMHPFAGSNGSIAIIFSLTILNSFRLLGEAAWQSFHASGVFPVGMAIVLIFIAVIKKIRRFPLSGMMLLIGVPVVYLFLMTAIATVSYVETNFVNPRYTTVALPFFYILVAYGIHESMKWKRWAGIALMIIYVTTNGMAFEAPRAFLYEFVSEMMAPYQTPGKPIADFLKTHAIKGQTAFVSQDDAHELLIFLLGDDHALRFVNRVDMTNTRIFPQNRRIIPRYVYDFRGEPDWVILYSRRGFDGTFYTMNYRQLWPEVDLAKDYIEHILPVYFADMSRPEIELRSFTGEKPRDGDYVYIYEKK